MDLSMCRICLVEDVRMESILDTNLQETFEKLTEMPFETEKSRPLQLCYICCAKLRNCHQLQVRCLQSEKLFQQMLTKNAFKSTPLRYMKDTLQSAPSVISLSIVPPEEPLHNENIIKIEDWISDDQELKEEALDGVPVLMMSEQHVLKRQLYKSSSPNQIYPEVKQEDNNTIVKKRLTRENHIGQMKVVHDHSEQQQHKFTPSSLRGRQKGLILSEVDEYTNKKPHVCDVCGKTFSRKCYLRSHMFTHTGDSPYKCDKCGKFLTRQKLLTDHMRIIHDGEKPYKCDICQKYFSKKHNLKNHVRLHTGDRPYKCGVCGKGYTSKTYLSMHMRGHTKCEKSHKCNNSDQKNFIKKDNFSKCCTKPYKCDFCEKFYSTKAVLKNHIRFIHMGEKLYKCDICEKGYGLKHRLISHINSHSGYKPYQCHLCNKGFTQNIILKSHLYTHINENAYKCDFCAKCLSSIWALREHIRVVHVGEKPFKCIICDRCFGKRANLRSHIRKHTGEKPFPCQICDKYFRYQCDLIKHVRTHTGDKPYECEICKEKFSTKKKINNHICIDSTA